MIVPLQDGAVLLTPTDTVMGIACVPGLERRLNDLKGSPDRKPLVRLASGPEQALAIWGEVPYSVLSLAELWPGALTIIAGASKGGSGVAVRVPDYPPLRKLLGLTGPLSCTSANRSGRPAPARLEEVDADLAAQCELVVDDPGHRSAETPSTILAYGEGGWKLIREGALPASAWEPRIGRAERIAPEKVP